jgi:hypothetical protein
MDFALESGLSSSSSNDPPKCTSLGHRSSSSLLKSPKNHQSKRSAEEEFQKRNRRFSEQDCLEDLFHSYEDSAELRNNAVTDNWVGAIVKSLTRNDDHLSSEMEYSIQLTM